MIDFHYVQRPAKLSGFVRRGDFVAISDEIDSPPRVYMKINEDGSGVDPADWPEMFFEFHRRFDTSSEESTEDSTEDYE